VERTHFIREAEDSFLLIVPGYPDATEARKALKTLVPGTYHLVTFVEADIVVEPPSLPTDNVVKRGKTFVTRRPFVEE
jgi:hypothetical protein